MFRKHAATTKFVSLIDQLENYVLALLTNGRHMFHLDNEFAVLKVCSCLCARAPQFGCPWSNELSLHNQPTLPGTIDQRNLQHSFFLLLVIMQGAHQTRRSVSRLIVRRRPPEIETARVEEVERVETVERIG